MSKKIGPGLSRLKLGNISIHFKMAVAFLHLLIHKLRLRILFTKGNRAQCPNVGLWGFVTDCP